MKRFTFLLSLQILVLNVSFSQQTNSLLVGQSITDEIRLQQVHPYTLVLEKGDFALINLQQQGIDLAIETYDVNNKLIEKFDSPNGSFGEELILIDAVETGLYELKVLPLAENKKEKVGTYTIEVLSIQNDLKNHLDATLKSLYKRNFIPSFAVSIVDEQSIVYQNTFGYADLNKKTPYTSNTKQGIASISKTFIGLSLMLLVEQGKVHLDEDVNTYLPFQVRNPFYLNHPITIRQLANHTSSINDGKNYNKAYYLANSSSSINKKINKPIRKELEKLSKHKKMELGQFLAAFFSIDGTYYTTKNFLKQAPGKGWYYSNVGAGLAAYIVEVVSGQSYDRFVQEQIIRPLGLTNTFWNFEVSNQSALKYDRYQNELPEVQGALYPDGSIITNSTDLSQYLLHWIQGYNKGSELLSAASYQEIMKVQNEEKEGRFKGRKDGLFWEHQKDGRLGHSGGEFGVSARMYFYPNSKTGYTFLENMMPTESDDAYTQSLQVKKILERYCRKW